jgi:hypothetical protein
MEARQHVDRPDDAQRALAVEQEQVAGDVKYRFVIDMATLA